MINQNELNRKLDIAGLQSVRIGDHGRLKRVAQMMAKQSNEHAQYITEVLCKKDVYIAADCIRELKNPSLNNIIYKELRNLNNIYYKSMVYFRLRDYNNLKDSLNEWQEMSFKENINNVILPAIISFSELLDLCKLINESEDNMDIYLYYLVSSSDFTISELYEKKDKFTDLLSDLFKYSRSSTIQCIFKKITAEEYYKLTKHSFEDIAPFFDFKSNDLEQIVKYCYLDSKVSNKNKFSHFYKYINANEISWAERNNLLLCEYQVKETDDYEFNKRCEETTKCYDKMNNKRYFSPLYKRLIVQNLIEATLLCLKEKRNANEFIRFFRAINYFSLKADPLLVVEYVDSLEIWSKKAEYIKLYVDYAEERSIEEALDLYLNSFLKQVFTIDFAFKLLEKYTSIEMINLYLNNKTFRGRIAYLNKSFGIIKLIKLDSKSYKYNIEKTLFDSNSIGEKLYIKLGYNKRNELYVKEIQKCVKDIERENNFYFKWESAINIIENIDENLENQLYELREESEVPIYYVRKKFSEFLKALMNIEDVHIFMLVLAHLSWNKKYFYKNQWEEISENVFLQNYTDVCKLILGRMCKKGLSDENLIEIYFNTFFKFAVSINDLYDMFKEQRRAKEKLQRYPIKASIIEEDYTGCYITRFTSVYCKEDVFVQNIKGKYSRLGDIYVKLNSHSKKNKFVYILDVDTTYNRIILEQKNRLIRAYKKVSKVNDSQDYIYEYINLIDRKVLLEDIELCKQIAGYIERAFYIRHNSYAETCDLINSLGESNLYYYNRCPIPEISIYKSKGKEMELEAKKLGHSFIRNSRKLSEAFYLYINSHVKNNVSIKEFLSMCYNCKMEIDEFEIQFMALAKIIVDDSVKIFFIDTALPGLSYNINLGRETKEFLKQRKLFGVRVSLTHGEQVKCKIIDICWPTNDESIIGKYTKDLISNEVRDISIIKDPLMINRNGE